MTLQSSTYGNARVGGAVFFARVLFEKPTYPTYGREMEWLNYHHLLYFWMVAKEGSIVRASKELRLAHPTISGQIHRLEEVLGEKLFVRRGRDLALTAVGQMAFRYANDIFALGGELLDVVKGRAGARPIRLVVGVSDVLAKSIVHRILEPAFHLGEQVRLVCREDRSMDAFMADLAVHAVDVVLADAPAGTATSVRAFSHLLGECGAVRLAAPALAKKLRKGVPGLPERCDVSITRCHLDAAARAGRLVRRTQPATQGRRRVRRCSPRDRAR